jgi:replicative DNA helicase
MICSINSPGKTTFVLNIANNVANVFSDGRGREVLIHSLETSSDELILKSLICEMFSHQDHTADTALTHADIVSVKDPYTDSGVLSHLKSSLGNFSKYNRRPYR